MNKPLLWTLLMIACSVSAAAAGIRYRSVSLDPQGKLTLVLSSGERLMPAKLPDQAAFQDAQLAKDHKTVGWLAAYPSPETSADLLPQRLVLYRSGRIHRIFTTDQIFWSWRFANVDHDVAFCTGPTHGGAEVCELHRLAPGYLLARWSPASGRHVPRWAKGLRF